MNFIPDLSDYPTWAKVTVASAAIIVALVLIFARRPKPPTTRPQIVFQSRMLYDAKGTEATRLAPDAPYVLMLVLKNTGNHTARNVLVVSNWMTRRTEDGFPDAPDYPKPWRGDGATFTLGAGEVVRHPIQIEPQPQHQFQGINLGALIFYAYGEIKYSDETRDYFTHFCFRYIPESGEWVFTSKYNDSN